MKNFWLKDCCTGGIGFASSSYYEKKLQRRQEFLEKWSSREGYHYPFKHEIIYQLDAPWYKNGGWGLDPLIIPLLTAMNNIPDVVTIASCQGNANKGPTVIFGAHEVGMLEFQKLIRKQTQRRFAEKRYGSFYHHPIISLDGKMWEKHIEYQPNLPTTCWHLWFYDTLALMEFNLEALDISIAQQLTPPEYLLKLHEENNEPLIIADAVEIESILRDIP